VWDADVDDVVDVADVVREADPLSEMGTSTRWTAGPVPRLVDPRRGRPARAATEAANLTLRKGVGSADGWLFELRAEHPEALSTYQRYLAENDVDAELVRMHELDDHSTTSRYNLTPEQREALLTAYDGGYYDQPTDTDLESLADELSISRSAFSARLKARLPEPRRGHHRPRTGTERRPIARPPFNPRHTEGQPSLP